MKASYFMKNGAPEVMAYGDVADPVAAAGEVVVDVHAASINAADWKFRSGMYAATKDFPAIPGRDFSGVVSAIGAGVADFKVGDAVFGVSKADRNRCHAEKIAIDAAIVAKKPESLSHIEAAALALIGLTAIVSIEEALKLQPGETILIHGGAGGVAGFAVQLAKHLGARVITTASAANAEYVRKLGADEVIDYNAQDFTRVVSDIDCVFDTVGGEVGVRSFEVLKRGGRMATISGSTAPLAPREDLVSLRPDVARDRKHLDRIVQLVASGVIRVPEITVYPLSEAVAAHRVSEGRHLRGKLVLKVR